MLNDCGYKVQILRRTKIGNLSDPDLKVSKYRKLTRSEVVRLYALAERNTQKSKINPVAKKAKVRRTFARKNTNPKCLTIKGVFKRISNGRDALPCLVCFGDFFIRKARLQPRGHQQGALGAPTTPNAAAVAPYKVEINTKRRRKGGSGPTGKAIIKHKGLWRPVCAEAHGGIHQTVANDSDTTGPKGRKCAREGEAPGKKKKTTSPEGGQKR